MSLFCCLFVLFVVGGYERLVVDDTNGLAQRSLTIGESKPVRVNDASFVVVAQTEWKPRERDLPSPTVAFLDIHLQITNLAKKEVVFPTFNTFGIRLTKTDGKEVKASRDLQTSIVTGPVSLAAGTSFAIWRRAELRLDEKTRECEFTYYDGTGAKSVYGPLAPGEYKLAFWYTVAPDQGARQVNDGVDTWIGEVITHDLPIRILSGTIERHAAGIGEFLEFTNEIRRICESKSVTVKEAKFVVVAQTGATSENGKTPVEIQLRITNVSKSDMLFHTFDTFGLNVKTADGKQIRSGPGGGRDGCRLTKPVVIAPGASYSVCRVADISWNAETKANELRYYNGTGSMEVYRGLQPGCYRLKFYYCVSSNASPKELLRPENKMGGPETWLGEAETEEVVIEIYSGRSRRAP